MKITHIERVFYMGDHLTLVESATIVSMSPLF